jgi:hypothetical protein
MNVATGTRRQLPQMKKQNPNQPEVNAAFKAAMKESRSDGEAFTQKKSATVSLACIAKLKNESGEYVALKDEQRDIISAMFYPTVEIRMKVIEATLKAAGVELDVNTTVLIKPLLNPSAVQKKLEEKDDPEKKGFADFLD